MTEHNHAVGDTYLADCPRCREDRRSELEAEVDFWGGEIIWDDDETAMFAADAGQFDKPNEPRHD